MKPTIVLTTYNRPAYQKRCLASLKRANVDNILIVDDCSTDTTTRTIIQAYPHIVKQQRKGICDSLLIGIDRAFENGAQVVMNLDADAIVRNDFIERMMELHEAFPYDLITGFHSTTKNKDGSERHEVIDAGRIITGKYNNITHIHWGRKKSVGGINFLWTRETWDKYKPIIEHCAIHGGNWDHQVSLASNGIICPIESLIEHIGIDSAMGHNADVPDTAKGFKMLSLPNVTLVCVDDNKESANTALLHCMKDIKFGEVKLVSQSTNFNNTSTQLNHIVRHIHIDKLNSKQAYSHFILKELHKYIDTPYCLIVQHDGYIKNPESWNNDFLKYDYIGATWHYKDGMNVGNGGFSLRSKRLLELSANLPTTKTHPEDEVICRDCRRYLEQQGIKFAPEALAQRFSFEGYMQPGSYTNQFGFHGLRAFRPVANPRMQGFIINQFLGLGDILFLVPLIRHWMQLGHDVIWPIADEYYSIKKHFPDIQFVSKSEWPRVRYDCQTEYVHQWQYGNYIVKPLRWNKAVQLKDAMTTKYSMYGLDFNMWRELRWDRDEAKECMLMLLTCQNTRNGYNLICQEFGNITDGGAAHRVIEVDNGLPNVYFSKIIDYSLLDWSLIIENATVIHAVSSSTLYMFETLNLKAKEVHLYSRKGGENDFEMVRPLISKNYIFHV